MRLWGEHVDAVRICVNSFKDNTMFVTTPSLNDTASHLSIELVLNDGSRIDTKRQFEYRSNPEFTDIQPRSHLIE